MFCGIFSTTTFRSKQPPTVIIGVLWKIDGYAIMGSTYQPFQNPMCGVYCQISIWARRCLQGSYSGQQLFVCDVTDAVNQCWLELDRVCGWRKSSFIGGRLSSLLEGIVQTNSIRPGTFHIRGLLFQTTSGWEHVHCLLSATPLFFEQFCNCQIVAEISALPTAWGSWMTQLATELVC